MNLAVVGHAANVEFQRLLFTIDNKLPFTRWNDGLGDVVGMDDGFPDPPGELGTTIRTATAIAGGGFEEESLTVFPELKFLFRRLL